MAITSPSMISGNVTAARAPTCAVMERPVSMEVPKSPRTSAPHQSRYCTGSGRSSPSSARSCATRSGGEFTPAITAATSPGRMRNMANTATEMASNATTNSSSRRSTNLMMPLDASFLTSYPHSITAAYPS